MTGIITNMNNKPSSYNETRGIYQNVNSRKKNQEFLMLSNNVDYLSFSY